MRRMLDFTPIIIVIFILLYIFLPRYVSLTDIMGVWHCPQTGSAPEKKFYEFDLKPSLDFIRYSYDGKKLTSKKVGKYNMSKFSGRSLITLIYDNHAESMVFDNSRSSDYIFDLTCHKISN